MTAASAKAAGRSFPKLYLRRIGANRRSIADDGGTTDFADCTDSNG